MQCPQCQHQNPDGSKFCLECGPAFGARCAQCAAELPARATFCNECGAEITGLGAKGLGVTGKRNALTPNPITPNALSPSPLSYTLKPLAEKILTSRAGASAMNLLEIIHHAQRHLQENG